MKIVDVRARVLAVAVLVSAGTLAAHHVNHLWDNGPTDLQLIMACAFLWLCFTAVVPYLHRDVSVPSSRTDHLRVTVIIPAHNEDPAMFLEMLESISGQTRLPQRVHVVENGDPANYRPSLREVFREWRRISCPAEVEAAYSFNPIPSKRHAQAAAIEADADADVYMTLDSDVRLHPLAIVRGIAPFASGRVACVGGLTVGLNSQRSLLTRLVELGYVGSFLNGRASWSLLGSVGVQCGTLAFYRGDVFRKYLKHYVSHTVAGRFMPYGDDAMATRYSLLEGKSLIQLGCLGYTLHPENIRHLTKQRLRWWRSWFWGNFWALRVFKPNRAIWWLTAINYTRFVWYSFALVTILITGPVISGLVPWMFLVWMMGIAYLVNNRYLSFRRPDQSYATQGVTYLLAPLSALLHFYLCTILQWVGLFTCLKADWSTRQKVEVTFDSQNRRLGETPAVATPR